MHIVGRKIIAAGKIGEEKITKCNSLTETVHSLHLVDTTKDSDSHLNDCLIENGFAAIKEGEVPALSKIDFCFSLLPIFL